MMAREVVTESWFRSFWWNSWKGAPESNKALIGILAFEVVSFMSKVVNLWHWLSDQEVLRLREEIVDSIGIQKLVSDDDDYLMDLVLNEIIENWGIVAKFVARLGKRCADPVYHRFEQFISNPIQNNLECVQWQYRLKKMERKVKKMERFIAATLQLSQELDVLAEVEQTFRRMQINSQSNRVKLYEFQQKVHWQRQEVRNMREMSPWNRTYDYIVRLLVRSLFTILERMKHVFEINQVASLEGNANHEYFSDDCLRRSHSFSAFMHSSVYPSENHPYGFYSVPLGRSVLKSELTTNSKQQQSQNQSSAFHGKPLDSKTKRSAHIGPFKGCMMGGSDSPIIRSYKPTGGGSMRLNGIDLKNINKMEDTGIGSISHVDRIYYKIFLFNSKCGLLNAPPHTLGNAALDLHYANVIVLIEKLASSPHMIDLETRDDLYNMLPTSIKTALRARFKAYGKTLGSSVYDPSLTAQWSLALMQMLEWLGPLAHNMIRWQSERNFEKEHMVSGANVLLVQTLHYANQAITEAAIIELLVGLNYIYRITGERKGNALQKYAGDQPYDDYLINKEENHDS